MRLFVLLLALSGCAANDGGEAHVRLNGAYTTVGGLVSRH